MGGTRAPTSLGAPLQKPLPCAPLPPSKAGKAGITDPLAQMGKLRLRRRLGSHTPEAQHGSPGEARAWPPSDPSPGLGAGEPCPALRRLAGAVGTGPPPAWCRRFSHPGGRGRARPSLPGRDQENTSRSPPSPDAPGGQRERPENGKAQDLREEHNSNSFPGFHNRGRLVSLNGELAFPEPGWQGGARAGPWTLPQARPSSAEGHQRARQSLVSAQRAAAGRGCGCVLF